MIPLWILDAGHGIETKGKCSPGKKTLDDGRPGIIEYEFNRDIVRLISEDLALRDIPYHIVCQDEHTLTLDERVAIQKTMADAWNGNAAFVSVHSNAAGKGGWQPASGFRVFSFGAHSEREKFMADRIIAHVKECVPEWAKKCRPKTTRFRVICPANIPCILTESGFMTSLSDCEILMSEAGRQAIADYHTKMILDCNERWDAS